MIEIDIASGEVLSNTAEALSLARSEAPYDIPAQATRLQLSERENTLQSNSTLPVDLVNVNAAAFVTRNENIRR